VHLSTISLSNIYLPVCLTTNYSLYTLSIYPQSTSPVSICPLFVCPLPFCPLSTYLSIYTSNYLSVCLSIYLSVQLPGRSSAHPPVRLSVRSLSSHHLSAVHLSTNSSLSIYSLSVCLLSLYPLYICAICQLSVYYLSIHYLLIHYLSVLKIPRITMKHDSKTNLKFPVQWTELPVNRCRCLNFNHKLGRVLRSVYYCFGAHGTLTAQDLGDYSNF
jgi:hypothetical protein